jgi:hypothetical protein
LTVVLLASGAALAGCGGSASSGKVSARTAPANASGTQQPSPRYYARRSLAIGRLPNREGFGIFAQRYKFQGRTYVQLLASVVPPADSITAIQREIDSGRFGSSQVNINDVTAPVELQGLVGCSQHPVVLLYGLLHQPSIRAVLRAGASGQPLARVSIPADLHVRADLIYGFLTTGATLELSSRSDHAIKTADYLSPPSHHECAGGETSILYAFRSH